MNALRWTVLVFLLAWTWTAAPARAQGGSPGAAASPAPGAVADVDTLFRRGMEAYRAPTADFAGARAHWIAALAQATHGESSGVRAQLCKSLGNVAFRQERPLEAAAWFTAAIRLLPRDGDAWANLEFSRSKAGLEPLDRGDLASTVRRLLLLQSLAEAEWLVLILAAVVLVLLSLRATVLGSAANRPLIVLCLLLSLSVVPWVVQWRESTRDPLFVVSTAGINVGSEPRASAAKVAVLSAGAEVLRLEELAGWTRVQCADGTRGWVASDTVFVLRR